LRKDTERLDIEKAIDFFCNKAFLTQERIGFFCCFAGVVSGIANKKKTIFSYFRNRFSVD
jgi:hypothetical protein